MEESDSVYLFSSCKVEVPIIYIYLTGYILSYVGRMQHSCNGVFQPETHGHLDGELKKCFSKQIQNHELSPSVMKMKIYLKKKHKMKYALGNFYYFIIYFYLLNVLSFSLRSPSSNFQGLLHNHRKKTTLFIFKSKLKISWDLQTQQP